MMEKLQEKKWVCNWCNKVFSTGNALGGHMSIHRCSKRKPCDSDMGFEANEYYSHGGKENPKKFKCEKFTGSENSVTLSQNICVVCGKGFWSVKAVHGHMRYHNIKEREEAKCKKNGKGIETLSGGVVKSMTVEVLKETGEGLKDYQILSGQSDSEDTGCFTKDKMSITVNSRIGSFSAMEFNQEELQAAEILVMLSNGVRNLDASKGEVGNKPDTSVSDTRTFRRVKELGECSKTVLAGLNVVPQKLFDKNGSASCDTKMLCKKEAEYKCKSCGKVFNCHKAFGGHCSGHAKNNTQSRSSCKNIVMHT